MTRPVYLSPPGQSRRLVLFRDALAGRRRGVVSAGDRAPARSSRVALTGGGPRRLRRDWEAN